MSSLDFLLAAERAALHCQTYISVLTGLLPHGSHKRFAEDSLGITPVYLSNLLDPDHAPPSPALAERIVKALPLDADQRVSLLEHMLLAREESSRKVALLNERDARSQQDVQEVHAQLRLVYDRSNLISATDSASQSIVGVRDAGKALLQVLNACATPLIYTETCLIVHAAQMALNRWDDALYLTLIAQTVLEQTDAASVGRDVEWLHHLRINVQYAQAVTYRNLNLPKRAEQCLRQAESMLSRAANEQRAIWLPQVYRDQMGVLWQTPRFALSEVEGIADQVDRIVQKRAASGDAVLLLLIDRALIDAYIRYGSSRSLKRAGRLIQLRLDELEHIPGAGPMQRTMFLRSALRYFWKQDRHDEWRHYATRFMQIASHASLLHQIKAVHREYGSALEEID